MRSVRASTKRSWMPLVTISREDAVQRCPVEKNAPLGCALDRDLDLGVIEHHKRVLAAHLDLHLFHRHRGGRSRRDLATDPVNETAATSGCRNRVSPISLPRPMTRLKTPAGSPDREMISARTCAEPGTRSAGLNTTQLP